MSMSSIKAFFEQTFFMNGTEGIILFAICLAAAVLTLVAIVLAVVVAVSLHRRRKESVAAVTAVAVPTAEETPAVAAPTAEETPAVQPASRPVQAEPVPVPDPVQAVQPEPSQPEPTAHAEPVQPDMGAEPPFVGSGVRYDRSFTAKLIQASDESKKWYATIKNELLSYRKVKARMSWKRESFRIVRDVVARLSFRGGTLCLYLPLESSSLQGSKYRVEDASSFASYTDTPCMYRLKGERRVRYAAELIAALMDTRGIERTGRAAAIEYLPYEDTQTLIGRGLIKWKDAGKASPAPADGASGEAVEVMEEVLEEAAAEETKETPEETLPIEEGSVEAGEPVEEIPEEEPIEEPAVPAEEIPQEKPEEGASEQTDRPADETEVEALSSREIEDVQSYEEEAEDEDGIDVVGVMFRRRGRKVYWFDPDGKTWEKGEIAFYTTPTVPPQEVIVVDTAKRSPSKLHLPLKPLLKASRLPRPRH